jgi:hypothetical protein
VRSKLSRSDSQPHPPPLSRPLPPPPSAALTPAFPPSPRSTPLPAKPPPPLPSSTHPQEVLHTGAHVAGAPLAYEHVHVSVAAAVGEVSQHAAHSRRHEVQQVLRWREQGWQGVWVGG